MCLNETLDFTAAASLKDRNAFLGTPDKIRIDAGTKLFKWTSFPLAGAKGITPWWSFFERTTLPSGLIADGFQASEGYAKRLSVSGRNYARARSAVSEQFENSMDNLLVIQLISCFFGFA